MGIYRGYVENTTKEDELMRLSENDYTKNGYSYDTSYLEQNNVLCLCFDVSKRSILDFFKKILSIDENCVVYVNTDIGTTYVSEIIHNKRYIKLISNFPEYQEDFYDENGNDVNMTIIKNRERKQKLIQLTL